MMANRLRKLGYVLALAGLGFIVLSGIAWVKVQDGYHALGSFSEAQNVTLSYNEDGDLVDRGTVEGAQAIRSLLEDDWGFRIVESDLDPDDPLVNTATEYMFQMATIGYHTLTGTQTVTVPEDITYNDVFYPAGEYEFEVDGRYWTDFDRRHPIEGPARSQAWSGTTHGLFGELGVGTVTHSALQIGLAVAGIVAALGGTLLVAGLGLIWATRDELKFKMPEDITPKEEAREPAPVG